MALSITVGTLVSRAQKRADKEGDGHFPSAEIKEVLFELYGEMHAAVVEAGARYFETEQSITATGAASYNLPADYLSTVGVDFVLDAAGQRRELVDINVLERTEWLGTTGEAHAYALVRDTVELYPKPPSGSYKHIYVPQPTDISAAADGTSLDVISIFGLKFLLWGVAAVGKHKSDENQQRSMLERDKALEQVVCWANQRALHVPKRRIVRLDEGYAARDVAGWWNRP